MKPGIFRYVVLLFCFAFFGKAFASPTLNVSKNHSKESQFHSLKKCSEAVKLSFSKSKISRQKRPKKPKGIKVIVPDVTSHNLQKFFRYSEFIVHEAKGNYSLLLHYSHGKRGPPVLV